MAWDGALNLAMLMISISEVKRVCARWVTILYHQHKHAAVQGIPSAPCYSHTHPQSPLVSAYMSKFRLFQSFFKKNVAFFCCANGEAFRLQ